MIHSPKPPPRDLQSSPATQMLAPEYNPISRLAVAASITAAMGITAFVAVQFIVFAVAAIPVGLFALRAIRKYEFGGRNLALGATTLAAVTVLLAPAWHNYQYHSETLPGHTRLSLDIANSAALDSLNGFAGLPKGVLALLWRRHCS